MNHYIRTKHISQKNKARNRGAVRRLLRIEMLEDRRLLATTPISVIADMLRNAPVGGVTVVTHGFQPHVLGSPESLRPLADAIRDRADSENGDLRTAWMLDYDSRNDFDVGIDRDSLLLSDPSDFGIPGQQPGNVVLLYDWFDESNELSAGWGEAAGDALFSLMVGLNLIAPTPGASNPSIHMIGHSFGAAVTSEAVERMLTFGIAVDQVTYLDSARL